MIAVRERAYCAAGHVTTTFHVACDYTCVTCDLIGVFDDHLDAGHAVEGVSREAIGDVRVRRQQFGSIEPDRAVALASAYELELQMLVFDERLRRDFEFA